MLPLRIETGRYHGEPIQEGICTFRGLDEVDDELPYKNCQNDFLKHVELIYIVEVSNLYKDLLSEKKGWIFSYIFPIGFWK